MPRKKAGMWRNKNSSTRKKATPYKNRGVTEVGKEAKTQSYKEYVQKMFGGGMTKGMWVGGRTDIPTGGRPPLTPPPIGGPPRPPRPPRPPSTPGGIANKLKRWRDRNPDPVLPRGKRGKGPGI